jgi:hypothetical protein
MSQERKPTFGFFVAVAIMAFVLVPTLYGLSVGPAVFLVDIGVISEDTLELAYAPLACAADCLPEPAKNRFQGYIQWWADLAESTGR